MGRNKHLARINKSKRASRKVAIGLMMSGLLCISVSAPTLFCIGTIQEQQREIDTLKTQVNEHIAMDIEYRQNLHVVGLELAEKVEDTFDMVRVVGTEYDKILKFREQYYKDNVPMAEDWQYYLKRMCDKYNVPFNTALSIIRAESYYDAGLIHTNDNGTQDWGLMQINDCNKQELDEEFGEGLDWLNPYDNIQAGVFMLGELYKKYNDEHTILMAYNFGEAGMRKAKANGNYSSVYSRRVLQYKEELRYES